jgi:hypothetical protein
MPGLQSRSSSCLEFLRAPAQITSKQKEEAPMSVVPAKDLLRAVAGAAKLKRLWLQVGQLFNPARLIARIPRTVGATRCQPNGASNDQRQRKC